MLVKAREMGAARLACDIAALLSERDVLHAAPGARDADLRLRVSALRGRVPALPAGLRVDARALQQAARSSTIWQREFSNGSREAADADEWTGLLVGLAYPDRIGRARDKGGRYLLANGRGARFAEPQALAKSEFIVAAELDGAEREARIFLAAPIRPADLERHFAAHISEHREIAWDEREQAVRARRERRLGALVLESSDIRQPDPLEIQKAVLSGLRQMGLAALPWSRDLRQWQARVGLMLKCVGARAGSVARPERRRSHRDARGMGARHGSRGSFAATILHGWIWQARCARAYLRARRDTRARGADAFRRAERLANSHRLSRRRGADAVGAAAGDVRTPRDTERRERPAAPAVEAALAGRPTRTNHARSRELLEPRVSRGEEGSQGPLPEALLAGRSFHGGADAARAPRPATHRS